MNTQAPFRETNTDMPVVVYVMYLASLVIGVTALIGVGLAYAYRKKASERQESHYTYQIHTFWKGSLILVVSMVLASAIGIVAYTPLVFWWAVRCVKGLKALVDHKAIDDPATWLF